MKMIINTYLYTVRTNVNGERWSLFPMKPKDKKSNFLTSFKEYEDKEGILEEKNALDFPALHMKPFRF